MINFASVFDRVVQSVMFTPGSQNWLLPVLMHRSIAQLSSLHKPVLPSTMLRYCEATPCLSITYHQTHSSCCVFLVGNFKQEVLADNEYRTRRIKAPLSCNVLA